jgi:exfoliative toxin A/B
MERIIKKIPIPICGLMLALAAIGNLVSSYGILYKNIFCSISAIILLLFITKIFTDVKGALKNLDNPIVASVIPTFPMGAMILSTYIKPYIPSVAYIIWIFSLILHCILIFYFTRKFIFNFDIKRVFPSYFVVYVGIVVGSVTAPAYSHTNLGQLIFWFGFVSYLLLLPIVSYRVFIIKSIQEPALPLTTIFAAPASLCLAGYMSTFQEKNTVIVGFLTVLSIFIALFVLLYMPKMLRIKFYPSYSAFTFPWVISAIAMKKVNGFLQSTGNKILAINYIASFVELIAILMVTYVLARYINFVMLDNHGQKDTASSL